MLVRLCVLVLLVAAGCGGSWQSEQDSRAIEAIRRAGGDPTKPRPIEYYLYFDTRVRADGAERDLRQEGFRVQLSQAPDAPWLVLATRTGVLTRDLAETEDLLEDIADRHEGVYYGWEAPEGP